MGSSHVLKAGAGCTWLPAREWPELRDFLKDEVNAQEAFPKEGMIYREKPKQKMIDWGKKEKKRFTKQRIMKAAEKHLRVLAVREKEMDRLRAEQAEAARLAKEAEAQAIEEARLQAERIAKEAERRAKLAVEEEARLERLQDAEASAARVAAGTAEIPLRPEDVSLEPNLDFDHTQNDLFAIFDSEVTEYEREANRSSKSSPQNHDEILDLSRPSGIDSFENDSNEELQEMESDDDFIVETIADRDSQRNRLRKIVVFFLVGSAGLFAGASIVLSPKSDPQATAPANINSPELRESIPAVPDTQIPANDTVQNTIIVGRDSIRVQSAGIQKIEAKKMRRPEAAFNATSGTASVPAGITKDSDSLPSLKPPTRPKRK